MIKNYFQIFCLGSYSLFIISCGDSSSELTKVTPDSVAYNSTTEFTLTGKHLAATLAISLHDQSCSNITSNENGTSVTADCTAPDSGDHAIMRVKLNDKLIKNGAYKIALLNTFQKFNASGQELSATATDWVCLKDNATGITWASSNPDPDHSSPLYSAHKYQWSKDATSHGNTTDCQSALGETTKCNSFNYIQYLNDTKFCNLADWELPDGNELRSIFSCNKTPRHNSALFPHHTSNYWTSSELDATTAGLAITGICSDTKIAKTSPQHVLGIVKGSN